MAAEEAVHGRGREALPMPRLEPLRDLGQRDMNGRLDHSEDRRAERLDPVGTPVTALGARRDRAGFAPQPMPLHRHRRRDAEPRRSRTAARASVNRANDTLSKVEGKRSGHEGWPPSPALTLNHERGRTGIPPSDSMRSRDALDGGSSARAPVLLPSHRERKVVRYRAYAADLASFDRHPTSRRFPAWPAARLPGRRSAPPSRRSRASAPRRYRLPVREPGDR